MPAGHRKGVEMRRERNRCHQSDPAAQNLETPDPLDQPLLENPDPEENGRQHHPKPDKTVQWLQSDTVS